MTAPLCVVVCGSDRDDRAALMQELIVNHGNRGTLLLTGAVTHYREFFAEHDGVEVRDDDPAALARSYRQRLQGPAAAGPSLLLRDRYGALARSLPWEYLRRACESKAWGLVIRELDGYFSAVQELLAPRDAAALIEQLWPRNARYAALAAGDRIDSEVSDAHEVAGTLDTLEAWIAGAAAPAGNGRLEVRVAGSAEDSGADAAAVGAMGALLGLGSQHAEALAAAEQAPPIDGLPSYVLRVAVPATPDAAPAVIDGALHLRYGGVPLELPLNGVLARCVVADWSREECGADGSALRIRFVAEPKLWPESLLFAHSRRTAE